MATRTEKDTFGPIEVPAEHLWGAQTQRSLTNFKISGERMPPDLIRAYGSEAATILAKPEQQPLHDSSARRVSELDYCIESEACVGVADFLIRRTRAVLFDPERGRLSAEPVARRMAARLGWDGAEVGRQIDGFERELELYR